MIRATSKTDARKRWLREYQRARNSGWGAVKGAAVIHALEGMPLWMRQRGYAMPFPLSWPALVTDEHLAIRTAIERGPKGRDPVPSIYASILRNMRSTREHRYAMRRQRGEFSLPLP